MSGEVSGPFLTEDDAVMSSVRGDWELLGQSRAVIAARVTGGDEECTGALRPVMAVIKSDDGSDEER